MKFESSEHFGSIAISVVCLSLWLLAVEGVRGTFWQQLGVSQYLGKNTGIKQLFQMLYQAPVCAGLGMFYM